MFTQAKALAATAHNVIPLLAAGLFYYIFNFVVAMLMDYGEKRMNYYS
jgi:ABC-type amino acid transport system permease subunit